MVIFDHFSLQLPGFLHVFAETDQRIRSVPNLVIAAALDLYVEISLPQRVDGADKAAEWPCDRAGDQQPGEESGPDNTCNRGDDDQLDRKFFMFLCLVCGIGCEFDDFIDKGFEFVIGICFLCRDFSTVSIAATVLSALNNRRASTACFS